MKTCTVFFIITLISSVYCQEDQEPQVYCGRRLADTMAFLCQSVSSNMVKRSGSDYGLSMNFKFPKTMMQGMEMGLPWIAPRQARALGTMRGKRQIVSECCDKACTIDELLTYC